MNEEAGALINQAREAVDPTNSAGTLVAAVLEAAGYVQQGEILSDFAAWFHGAGAIFYIVSAVGAIISFAMFGSYRMLRYFIFGPALFWFLVGTTTNANKVVWKMGGGSAYEIEEALIENVEDYKLQGNTEVSTFFYYFTTFFSGVVNDLVDVILKFESDEDLLFVAKTQALDMLLNIKPQKQELFKILNGTLYGECETMMSLATAMSNRNLSPAFLDTLKQRLANIVDRDKDEELVKVLEKSIGQIEATKANLKISYDREATAKRVEINRATEQYIARKFGPSSEYYGKSSLTCRQVWEVSQEAILEEAAWFVEKVEAAHIKAPLDKNSDQHKQMLCRAIGEKLHRDYKSQLNADCNLVEAAGVFLLRHSISELNFSRVAQDRKNRMNLLRGINEIDFIDGERTESKGRPNRLKDGTFLQWNLQDGRLVGRILPDEYRDLEKDDLEAKVMSAGIKWRPFNQIESGGMMDIAYTEQQRYQSRGMMQELFTYAMHLPYWQGTLLYLLSVAYPFLCLMVVVPSRAGAFLMVPLTWLWLKSWDIGFALVMILDKILWNLLPTTDMPYNPITAQITGQTTAGGFLLPDLPSMLDSAFAVDPSYNVHVHYNFISMALLAVPNITGYAILKGKSSILSSFTNAPQQEARDATSLASGQYGAQAMHSRAQKMLELGGYAILRHGHRGEGVMGGGASASGGGANSNASGGGGGNPVASNGVNSGSSSNAGGSGSNGAGAKWSNEAKDWWNGQSRGGKAVAGMSGAALFSSMKGMISSVSKMRGGNGGANEFSRAILGGLQEGLKGGAKILTTQADYAAEYAAAFDPIYGRYGRYQIAQEAAASAMDGGGGFEINAGDVVGMVNNAYVTQFTTLLNLATSAGVNAVTAAEKAPFMGKAIGGNLGQHVVTGMSANLAASAVRNIWLDSPSTEENELNETFITNVMKEREKNDVHHSMYDPDRDTPKARKRAKGSK